MRDTVLGYEVVSTPDPPVKLLRILSDAPPEASYVTYRLSAGPRKVAFVNSAVSAVLTYMMLADSPLDGGFTISNIVSGLRISIMKVAKALAFMYNLRLVCEIRFDDGFCVYMLTNAGYVLAGEVFDLEGEYDFRWPVGIAIPDDGEPRPILFCPRPLVKLKKAD